MEKENNNNNNNKTRKSHFLVLAYPHVGHINPMLQFSKRLQQQQGVRVTLVTTRFCCNNNTLHNLGSTNISLECISDGFDNGGIKEAESIEAYLGRFWSIGPQTFSQLLERLLIMNNNPIDCVVYDSFMPWALDIAKEKLGMMTSCAVFLTQPLFVNCIYYHVHKGNLKPPLSETEHSSNISLPGLPLILQPCDLPSFLYNYGSYPASFDLVVEQFSNIDKADWILCNTFYELEKEVNPFLAQSFGPLLFFILFFFVGSEPLLFLIYIENKMLLYLLCFTSL